jgi:hypothetical protein
LKDFAGALEDAEKVSLFLKGSATLRDRQLINPSA